MQPPCLLLVVVLAAGGQQHHGHPGRLVRVPVVLVVELLLRELSKGQYSHLLSLSRCCGPAQKFTIKILNI